MLAWFKPKPLVDEDELAFIVDTFVWAATHLDGKHFLQYSKIVTPSREDFPDTVNSIESMASSVFKRVVDFAGMSHWPLALVNPSHSRQQSLPRMSVINSLRGPSSQINFDNAPPIEFSFNPQQINQPEDLVASFAIGLSHLLVATVQQQTGELPPGGKTQLPQACDVIAVFLGFGVMLSNTAYQFKGGCGSCFNPYANRQAALTEAQTLFAHALVAHFKPQSQASKHLKPHLRSQYKQAKAQVARYFSSTSQPVLLAMESRQHA
ncbi:putative orphan protein [Pseudoalteromonas luteoviolacea B = ATCC 29581]|nr:putative orphan protein [Pseudoalteromonas luteoviolacea B = ATCC 29581]